MDAAIYQEYLFILYSYLLGSIPFGMVLSFIAGHGDIRKIGSGNIGATNVLRTGNKKLALITLICDSGKGAAAVLISYMMLKDYFLSPEFIMVASGFAAILGHMFPVWLMFKGGKGVATTLGTVLAISPKLGLMMIAIWLLMAFTFRYSSLSALTAFALAPFLAMEYTGQMDITIFTGVVAVIVFWRHKENIKRLTKGEESRIDLPPHLNWKTLFDKISGKLNKSGAESEE